MTAKADIQGSNDLNRMHIIRTYMDGWKCVRYCVICGLEEDDKRWPEPCAGKVVTTGKQIDKRSNKD